jgi:hydrogenase maturation protein HypF
MVHSDVPIDRQPLCSFLLTRGSHFSKTVAIMSSPLKRTCQPASTQRVRIVICGVVQGVGFRPFVYRLATALGLTGWVKNSTEGVLIEVEGGSFQLDAFLQRIESEKPPRSLIHTLESSWLNPIGDSSFEIRASVDGEKTAIVLPDIATCSDCLRDIFTPSNRRYRYPFTNCTNCGPRFSILKALPYDRPNTTMQRFQMCDRCQVEYCDPYDRRFHTQPNACPHCGPHLECWDREGQVLASHDQALQMAADAIRQGKIVAVKGLGGFHLIANARNDATIWRLRHAKHRQEKPFALMYPSVEWVKAHCVVSDLEEQLLRSPASPIVLLSRLPRFPVAPWLQPSFPQPAPSVAPNNPYLGIMLPYTPLHHLLMAELGFPVVATSGNRSEEPICIDQDEAIQCLYGIVDIFLVHDRPIARPVDDSIVRVMADREMVVRRARGYAPLPIQVGMRKEEAKMAQLIDMPSLLAVGAQLKNTVAFSMNQQVFVSQHLGDLNTVTTFIAFQQAIAQFLQLYELQPAAIACDWHPDYQSTHYAQELAQHLGLPVISVQHHYAHVLSCMAEHHLDGTALGIAWDGTGYGLNDTIWGGEFLHVTHTGFKRVAHFRTFNLPGGEAAIKQPRRSAIGLLYELFKAELFQMQSIAPMQAFSEQEQQILHTMLTRTVNAPATSSVGRLIDAIASIVGLRQQTQFEGQAAMELEFAIGAYQTDDYYPFELIESPKFETSAPIIIDWAKMLQGILSDIETGLLIHKLSAKMHNTLVETIVTIAQRVGEKQVVLTGGCFQNKYLTERAVQRLNTEGFCPYWHQRIPPNDAGIALGQIMAASRELSGGKSRCV